MNYKTYSLRKKISKLFYNVMKTLTYPLRKSYNNKGAVYKLNTRWSDAREGRKSRKIFIRKIFYYLDQTGECYVLTNGTELEGNWFDIDRWGGIDKTVLEDTEWFKKNKLKITQVDSMEFMEKYNVPPWEKRKFEEYEIVKIEKE